jgi:hypothetical protein
MIDYRVAIKRRYEITEEMKQRMIEAVDSIISDPLSSKREVVSACKVMLAAEQQNQADEKHIDDNSRILEFAERLGIGAEVEAAAKITTGRITSVDDAEGEQSDL